MPALGNALFVPHKCLPWFDRRFLRVFEGVDFVETDSNDERLWQKDFAFTERHVPVCHGRLFDGVRAGG